MPIPPRDQLGQILSCAAQERAGSLQSPLPRQDVVHFIAIPPCRVDPLDRIVAGVEVRLERDGTPPVLVNVGTGRASRA
jgi:hypothetical protein